MKKITFAILAIAFIAAFNSCKEEEEIQTPEEDDWEYFAQQYDKDTPRTPGSFVMFGANTYYNTGVAETRTAYSDAEFTVGESTKERIDWVEGDNIQVFCNQSSAAMDAVYSIYDHQVGENPVQSVAPVHLVSAQGLKWGTTDPHIFHGIYPKENTIALNSTVSPQYPKVTNRDETTNGYTGASLKFITCVPAQQPYPVDMNLAGMVATTIAPLSDRGNVTMVFYPIVTTLQFDLKNVSKRDITINEIFIDGADVAGKYDVEVKDTDQVLFDIEEDSQHQASVYGINKTLATGSDETVRVVLFALPMEFTHAKLGIKMTIDGLEVTRKVALNYKEKVTVNGETTIVKKDIVFQPTHKYNFTIEIPESIVFEVNPEEYNYEVAGGTDMITVTSYTYNALGEKTPVAWTATRYSLDGGTTWNTFGPDVLNPDQYDNLPTMLKGWGVFNTVDVPADQRQFVTPVNEVVAYNKPPYEKLRHATPAVDVDLSMRDVNGNPTATMNTANCYLVHARGTYKFPVVYGNGIKNGATNTIAFNPVMDRSAEEIQDSITYSPYKKTGTDGRWITLPNEPYYSLTDDESREKFFGNTLTDEEKKQLFNLGWGKGWTMENNPAKYHFLSPFLNHTGQGITDPWLKNNTGVNPTTATLLWQDSKGLIKNVTLDGDYVKFEVTSVMSDLVEGNALIAVTDGTNILWNWHIWITEVTEDQNINSTDSPSGNVYAGQTMAATIIGKKVVENSLPNVTDAKIAAFLGLCDLSVSPKEIKIEFVQEGTEATEIVTLKQKGLFDMNAPFYQYGRKDPLKFQKGINGDDRNVFKSLYTITNGNVTTTTFKTTPLYDAVYKCILKPLDQCTNNGLDERYFNLWAARLTRPGRYDAVRADKTKTVYDPCPVGYRVPSLADVAGWAGNNNSDGYNPQSGAAVYRRGRVIGSNSGKPYVVLAIDGESKDVYVPLLQGSQGGTLAGGWRLTETASWVSTPIFFSCVQSAFDDTEGTTPISYNSYNNGQVRRTEAFYWFYSRTQYYQKVRDHWATADQASHQIRLATNAWMNESGGNRNNAVNLFMVKERDTDTSLDNYQQETQN
ncbi:MAG: hypothetical protein IK145_02520 [Bacteroidales bacterium]|nr:hypothetical protein [Bacteroidales bacterium]